MLEQQRSCCVGLNCHKKGNYKCEERQVLLHRLRRGEMDVPGNKRLTAILARNKGDSDPRSPRAFGNRFYRSSLDDCESSTATCAIAALSVPIPSGVLALIPT